MRSLTRRRIIASCAIAAAGALQLGASFDIKVLPAKGPNVRIFLAQADADSAAELFVVSGFTLTLVQGPGPLDTITYDLDERTSAIDVADADGDGIPELYSVVGHEIRRRSLAPNEAAEREKVLFSRETLLSNSDGGPRPYVLVTKWLGQPALALPENDGLRIFSFDGAVLNHFPIQRPERSAGGLRRTYVTPPQAAPAGALEFWADTTFDAPASMLPDGGEEAQFPSERRAPYLQAREAADLPPEDWPWFALASTIDPEQRVAYALSRSRQSDTLIRIRRRETRDLSLATALFTYSPKRRYPGTLIIPPGPPPDFNADGYADLLLWTSPRPGTSIDSLIQAARARDWPVRLTAHLYSDSKSIYEGQPAARIEARLPIGWSLLPQNGLPLRHLVLRDISGDGRTDVGFATGPARFALWIVRPPATFSSTPDYTADLPEAIQEVALVADMGAGGVTVIALRGENALYLLSLPQPRL